MRIDMTIPSLIFGRAAHAEAPAPVRITQEGGGAVNQEAKSVWGPAAVLTISPQGYAAYEASLNRVENIDGESAGEMAKANETGGCQTCQNRTYVDKSNDGGVSFQTPTNIDPSAAASAVAAHESEHVMREQWRAEDEGREVVNQNVRLHTSICPDCGIVYVSGGVTETTTAAKAEESGGEQTQAA